MIACVPTLPLARHRDAVSLRDMEERVAAGTASETEVVLLQARRAEERLNARVALEAAKKQEASAAAGRAEIRSLGDRIRLIKTESSPGTDPETSRG